MDLTAALAAAGLSGRTLPTSTPVHIVDVGQGPPLLFLHAAPLWSYSWRGVLSSLRAGHRCVAVDLPGFGLSPAPSADLDLDEHAAVVVEVIDRLQLDDVVLVMNDVGGAIGTLVALARPERVAGLVPVDALGFSLRPFGYVRFMLATMRLPGAAWLNRTFDLLGWGLTMGGLPWSLSLRTRRLALHTLATKAGRDRAFGLLGRLGTTPVLDRMEGEQHRLAHLPVLALFGRYDPARLAGFSRRWAALYPNTVERIVPGGRHFSPEDNPAFIAAEIAQWHRQLARHRRSA